MAEKDEQREVLDSEILKARITKLEYGEKDKDGNFVPISEEDIRRIYIEETGQEPPKTINLYHSDGIMSCKSRDSGFDGTVVHFYDPDKGINQSYTITRGSEGSEVGGRSDGKPMDWSYNGIGIFTGKVNDQLQDAMEFEEWANKEINQFVDKQSGKKEIPSLKKYGLGHSLGGNHIQMMLLLGVPFDNVVVMNDAAPTVYQLAANDPTFFKEIRAEFGLKGYKIEDLYDLDPKKLQDFALEHYKNMGEKIHHLTSEEDALYPLNLTRGFIRLGTEDIIDTNPDLASLHDVLGRIPDKSLQSLQKYLAKAAPYYEEAGMDGLFHFATGIDNKFLENLSLLLTGDPEVELKLDLKNIAKYWLGDRNKKMVVRAAAFEEIKAHLPVIQKRLEDLVKQLPVLITIADSMSGEEGKRISDYLRRVQEKSENILKLIAVINEADLSSLRGFITAWKALKALISQLQGLAEDMYLMWETGKDLINALGGSFEAHGLEALINGLADPSRQYAGKDLIMTAGGGGAEKIEINISSASRLYRMGITNYEEKRLLLTQIQRTFVERFEQPFEWRKRELMNKISEMESNPHAYSYLLGSSDREMVSISVNEKIPPMPPGIVNDIDGIQSFFMEDIEKGRRLFENMKNAILEFFSEDELVAAIFELS
ncbi:DUF6792 domain-containing protein [Sporosarcina cyprini]|uniref:DUF6792 domain-containing protein n=1 Tax=Sporosarcina cyprini TaxID=2910523 RepID=UPI001EDF7BE3|nr:DUF6792 domain-containing protein [Sporosarcina cyprini]MCG3088466.1 hypothetical protein [Sporosarcina cyprini]